MPDEQARHSPDQSKDRHQPSTSRDHGGKIAPHREVRPGEEGPGVKHIHKIVELAGYAAVPDAAVVPQQQVRSHGEQCQQGIQPQGGCQSGQCLMFPQPPPGPADTGQGLGAAQTLIPHQIQGAQQAQQDTLGKQHPKQGVIEILMAVMGDRTRIQVQGSAGLGQVIHPLLEQLILPGHPALGQAVPLHQALVKVRQFSGIVVLQGVLQPHHRLAQKLPVLRVRQGSQPRLKLVVHPLAQPGGIRRGIVKKGPVHGRGRGQQQSVERQAQPHKHPQGGQTEQLPPLPHRQPHTRPSSR